MSDTKNKQNILQAPKGMRDFFGQQFYKRKQFFEHAQSIAEQYGFSGIETPIMEHTEIFNKGIGKGTDIIDKEMYNLTTLGGDRLTLRPEGTAPVIRSYIENGMGSFSQPQFFHYSGPFFRHDKPQKGRYRQLYQFGLEILGSRDPMYDALSIDVGYTIIKKTGKPITVKINSLGTSELRKQYTEKLVHYYDQHRDQLGSRDQKRIETNPFRILDSKDPDTVAVNQSAPTLVENLDEVSQKHFDAVVNYLDEMNIPHVIDPFLVRGMDYYEHTVFEYVTHDDDGNESFALGGGGRYDGLAEMIGHNKSVPSIGLGLGADRIIELENQDQTNLQNIARIPILITDTEHYAHVSKQIRELNNPNIFFYPLTQKIAKQMNRVQKEGYVRVGIIGENEIAHNTITYKDLKTGAQKEISFSEIADLV